MRGVGCLFTLRSVEMRLLRGLTLELSGRRRYDARARAEKMDGVPQPGPWWHAVGAPLERLVRPHLRVLLCEDLRGLMLRRRCATYDSVRTLKLSRFRGSSWVRK